VLRQSYTRFELIVADDSGTCAAQPILLARTDARIRYLAGSVTRGVALSILNAVNEAKSDLIAIINDDDEWEESLLAELVAPLATSPHCVAAFADHSVTDESGQIDEALSDQWSKETGRSDLPEGPVRNGGRFAVDKGIPIANCAVFRKSAIDWSVFVSDVAGAYDYWMSCLLAASGGSIYYVARRLARYRVHPGMETKRRSHDKNENMIFIFSALARMPALSHLGISMKHRLAEAVLVSARDKAHFGRNLESRRLLWKSFRLNFRLMTLAACVATFLPPQARQRLARLRSKRASVTRAGTVGTSDSGLRRV
jgi:glycosyltransferase involved in cell wall biosynthesis